TLRDIITKDQLRIKDLMEIKHKYEEKNIEENLTVEENKLIKNEIEMFKTKSKEDSAKIDYLNTTIDHHKAEKSELAKDIERKDKLIDNLNQIKEELKEKVKQSLEEKEELKEKIRKQIEEKASMVTSTQSTTIISSVNQVSDNSGKTVTSFDQYAITRELMIDYLYCLY